MGNKAYISIVVPVYGCSACLEQLYQRLQKSLKLITDDFEIILVNDASPDDSWRTIQQLAKSDNKVKGVNLSRNFGQHYAISAGLDYARGDWVVVMDCDLQDQPEMITRLYNKAQEGFDVVVGVRSQRKDNFFKKLASKLFYKVFDFFTDTTIDQSIGNFGIYSKKVISNVKRLKEQNRSFGLFVIWLGFSRAEIEIEHAKREHGKSAYTLRKSIDLAIDCIMSYSNKPLKITVKLGFTLSFISASYSLWLIISYYLWASPVPGWTSVMVSLFFLSGLIIASVGVMGIYIGKVFDETKNRPLYIIDSLTFKD